MSGRLRNRVTIQSQSTTQDAVGQETISWTTVSTVWAQINPLSGRDYYNQSGEHADITHEIMMRHGVTVRPGDRIVYGSRNFDVNSVLTVQERDAWLKIRARETDG